MKKIKAKLRYMDARGETTNTRWGDVTFDKDGLAEVEVPVEDLQLLRNMRWLDERNGRQGPSDEPEEAPALPPEPSAEPEGHANPDDTLTPPQGTKKRSGKQG